MSRVVYWSLLLGVVSWMTVATACSAAEPAAEDVFKIGIIGLDTSHALAFTRSINSDEPAEEYRGCRVVAAYPQGSKDIPSSVSRVPEYTEKIKEYGVKIVETIPELVAEVDAVLLESNDGRPHLEQVLPVLQAKKPVFIDKPVAGSLTDAIAIYLAADYYGVPVFTSSSLRYTDGAKAIREGSIGDVLGADAYSPCPLESTHPDFFWYGIHGVETLFAVMGPGCTEVTRVSTDLTDVAVGRWEDGRIGTFRGRRGPDGKYKGGYGGTAFGTKGTAQIGNFSGYDPLLKKIVPFLRGGEIPVDPEESLQIYAFMQAADESKAAGGIPVKLADMRKKARAAAVARLKEFGVDLEKPAVGLMTVPGDWNADVFANASQEGGNIGWYRAYTKVPDKWVKATGRTLYVDSVTLTVESVADAFEVFVNGSRIGAAGKFPPKFEAAGDEVFRFKIPPGLLKLGEYNTIAIRVYAAESEGGFRGRAPVLAGYFLESVMAGDWEFIATDDPSFAIGASPEKPQRAVFEEFGDAISAMQRPEELTPGVYISPEDSLEAMETGEDLEAEVVLSDPLIAQPLQMNFDARGRMWLVEYRQYPYPAGLKMVSRDRYYRAVYDQEPLPPPHHHKGMDRISIHEDTDGDGKYDTHKNFVDGLNIASAMAPGKGGVWVLNPPFLIFYPDENGDDIPDGDPVVHLEGFGLEDTHSVTNSLTWGPDGWLYAAHGSTVTSQVKTRLPNGEKSSAVYCEGAAIWRYHPETRQFELFAEGGGNAFGIEFDAKGRLYSGHNGGNTRGFHYIPGGHYSKPTGKFGPSLNPYSFGLLPAMQHAPSPRFTHDLVKYESTLLPDRFQGDFLCVDPLHQRVVHSDILDWGSSFGTEDVAHPLQGNDKVFRPVHIEVGPEGAVYVADFCEEFIAHGQHFQGQIDVNSGRVYRLTPQAESANERLNLEGYSSSELVDLLKSPNKWKRQTAQRLLGFRQDESTKTRLLQMFAGEDAQSALEALWALYQLGQFDEQLAARSLAHADPYIRMWGVRFTGEQARSNGWNARLVELAKQESHPEVLAQLVCTARDQSVEISLPIVEAIVAKSETSADPFLPHLLWWAMEAQVKDNLPAVLALFEEDSFWNAPVVSDELAGKLMRRLASSGTQTELIACSRLLLDAPDDASRKALMEGFEKAYAGRSLATIPAELSAAILKSGGGSLVLRVRQGDSDALKTALESVAGQTGSAEEREELIRVLGEVQYEPAVPVLLSFLREQNASSSSQSSDSLTLAALSALQNFGSDEIADVLIELFPRLPFDAREVALSVLASRPDSAARMVAAVESGTIEKVVVPVDVVRQLAVHKAENVSGPLQRLWPSFDALSAQQAQQKIEQFSARLEKGHGNPYSGRELFNQSCGKCHRLFDHGGKIGPDLTAYQRRDRERMLLNVVDPSREIREGFEAYVAVTIDGRVLTGFLLDQDQNTIVLRSANGQDVRLRRDDIDELQRQSTSLMPAGLLDKFTDQQLLDLWAYLQAGQPIN
ncbi:MAG: PVC-type heme-binding CxxCH protein [Rubinisphaera brasiliensis]|uniref:PVC-type heme-binding CxxCH protein n=1 Tax=Rubinisphaera brasiliensis TaxID=119 RepID=UPI0039187999